MCEAHRVPKLSAASFKKLKPAEERRRARLYAELWGELEPEIETLTEIIRLDALAELRELEGKFAGLRQGRELKAATVQHIASLEAVGQGYIDDLNVTITQIQSKRAPVLETRISGTLDKAGQKFSKSTSTRIGFKHPGFPKEIRPWINSRVPELADKMGVLRKRAVFRSVVRGVRSGETLDKIEGRIRQRYQSWAKSSPASIARTEVGFVHAQSQWATIKKLGIPPNELVKIWLTSRDSRVRGLNPRDNANHVVLDGKRRFLNQRFSNGLLYPRQPGGRASEVINCRCVLLFERKKGKMRRVKPGKFTTKRTVPFNQFGDIEPPTSIVLPEELIETIPKASRDDALEGARALFNNGKAVEPEISGIFKSVAKSEKGEIHGFAFRLKTRKSIVSKIGRLMNEEAMSLPQALDNIQDINRYTMVFEHDTFVRNSKNAIRAFRKEGWHLVKGNNAFGGDFYHGYNVKLQKGGQFIEIQFHTPTSIEIKEPSHILYTKSCDLPKGSADRLDMEEEIRKLWQEDLLPAGDWQGLQTKGDVLIFKPKIPRPFSGKPGPFDVGTLPFYNRVGTTFGPSGGGEGG